MTKKKRQPPAATVYRVMFPELLRDFQDETGLSVSAIATLCQVTERQVYNWREAKSLPGAECVIRLIRWSEANDGKGYELLVPPIERMTLEEAAPQSKAKRDRRGGPGGIIKDPNEIARILGI